MAEARACRESCALFDFSFVGRARLRGNGATALLEGFASRRLGDLSPGRIRYALRVHTDLSALSDLTIWCHGEEDLEVMSGRHQDLCDLAAAAPAGIVASGVRDAGFVYAVQGPRALHTLARVCDRRVLSALPWFGFTTLPLAGVDCLIGRLGYSGERGFEVLGPAAAATRVWQALAALARPAGALAMDRLRIEAGLMLFTRECRLHANAAELGLAGFFSRPLPPPEMRLVSFCATHGSLPTGAAWPSPGRRPRAGEIAITSVCSSALAGSAMVGLGFVPVGETATGATPCDMEGHVQGVALLPGPALADARERPRAPWPDG